MTDKELAMAKMIVAAIIIFLVGLGIGAGIVDVRINSEIRTDQVELKVDVKEILGGKQRLDSAIRVLLYEAEQIKLERQELRELKILLSKGEMSAKNKK